MEEKSPVVSQLPVTGAQVCGVDGCMRERTTELTSGRSPLEKSERDSGRPCFLTGLVVHSAQVHFEGANQYAS